MRLGLGLALTQLRRPGGFTPLRYDPALWLDASRAGALVTDGAAQIAAASGQSLACASNASLQTGDVDFWVSGWVRPDSLPTSNDIDIVAGKRNGIYEEYAVSLNAAGSNANALFFMRGPSGDCYLGSSASVPAGAWTHYLAWYDAVNDRAYLSLNGAAPDSAAYSGGPSASAAAFTLGTGLLGGGFDGRQDSVAFGKAPPGGIAAVASTIRGRLYNGGAGLTYADLAAGEKGAWGLVSWWNLNETTGTRYDSHGTNHLADTNGVGSAAGIAGGAAAATGDPLSRWSDLSAHGRHLLQPTAAYRPTLALGAQNGRAGVRLDGVDDNMASALEGGAALAQPAWEFVVFRSAADNYTNATVFDGRSQNESRLYIGAAAAVQVYAGSGGPNQAVGTLNQTFVAAVLFSGASSSMQLNDGPVVAGDAGASDVHALSVGDVSVTGQCLNGYVFERVRVPAANIGPAGVARMRAYLNTKWQVY